MSGSAAATRGPSEWKRELKRLVKAIADDGDDARVGAFEEAERAFAALRELRVSGGGGARSVNGKRPLAAPASENQRRKEERVEAPPPTSVPVPDYFLCPISSKLMRDPVVVASGQTYDRAFIQNWLNSGRRTCPLTQQVLSSTILIPNHLVRNMISQWCSEHGITLPPLENELEDGLITKKEQHQLDGLFAKLTTSSIIEKKQLVRQFRLLTKHNRSIRAIMGEKPEVLPQLVSVLYEPGLNNDPEVQEDAVTTILNISIHESNKKIVGDNPQAIPLLINALKGATMEVRANAAAALFSLSALDSNKLKIGELGALKPLVELLECGSPAAKKDAGSAIFNLCMLHENRARAVREGVVSVALHDINNQSRVDESLAILALLSANPDAVEEISETSGIHWLLNILRDDSCSQNKENAVVVLYSICSYDRGKLREVRQEDNASGCISKLAQSGTPRARRKASGILERWKRSMQTTHYSC